MTVPDAYAGSKSAFFVFVRTGLLTLSIEYIVFEPSASVPVRPVSKVNPLKGKKEGALYKELMLVVNVPSLGKTLAFVKKTDTC